MLLEFYFGWLIYYVGIEWKERERERERESHRRREREREKERESSQTEKDIWSHFSFKA